MLVVVMHVYVQGLDASSTLDIVKTLRVATKIMQVGIAACMYQVSCYRLMIGFA